MHINFISSSKTSGAPSLSNKVAWALVSANGFVFQLFSLDTGIASTTNPSIRSFTKWKDFEPQVSQGKVNYIDKFHGPFQKQLYQAYPLTPKWNSSVLASAQSFRDQSNFENGRVLTAQGLCPFGHSKIEHVYGNGYAEVQEKTCYNRLELK